MRRFVFCLLILYAAPASAEPLIHSLQSTPFTASQERFDVSTQPQLLGDRFEYRADDETGQFLLILPKPPEKQCSAHIALRDAGDKLVEEARLNDPEHHKVIFRVDVAHLPAGRHALIGELRDPAGKTVGEPLRFEFTRSDRRIEPANFPDDGITIDLPPQDALPDVIWPTRAAVPLPRGAVRDVRKLELRADGKPLPVDIFPRARWSPDGSIQWVHLHLNAQYRGGKPAEYRLHLLSEAQPPAETLRVDQNDDQISIDTGALRFVVGRKKFAGIEKAWLGEKLVIDGAGGASFIDGRGIRWKAADDEQATVEIEDHGAAAVTIVARGWYRAAEQPEIEPICQFVTRIRAYAGQPLLRITHHTILAYDTRTQYLGELGFHIAGASSGRWRAGIDGHAVSGEAIAENSTVFIHQDRHDRVRVVAGDKMLPGGTHADGWVDLSSADDSTRLTLTLRDMWQRFPKEIELSRSGATIFSWPRHGHRAFDQAGELSLENIYKFWCFHQGKLLDLNLPNDYFDQLQHYPGTEECLPEHALNGNGEGLAISDEFLLRFSDAAQDASSSAWAKLFDEDPTGLPPGHWNAATGAMGELAAVDRQRFAPMEDAIENCFLSYTRSVERGNAYGLWNYADTHTYWDPVTHRPQLHRVWLNSHYHDVGLRWLLYFRGGGRELLRWARASTNHYINVDTVNFALPDDTRRGIKFHMPGAMYHCKGLTHWGSESYGMKRRDTHANIWGHWVDPDAMLWAWYLDADRRAWDVYQMWHDSIRRFGLPLRGTAREINTSLAIATELYRATFDADLLPHIHGMGKSLRETPLEKQQPGPMWHPLWVNRYYEQTRDPAYVEFILKYGKHDVVAGTLGVSALAYDLSGDAQYLTRHFERLWWFPRKGYQAKDDPLYAWYGCGPGPLGSDWTWDTWGQFLLRVQRAGFDQIPAPTSGRGYCLFAPVSPRAISQPPSLAVMILQPADRAMALNTGFDFRHPGSVRLISPSGKVLLQEDRQGEVSEEQGMRPIPADGETGIYTLEFRGHWSTMKLPVSDEAGEAMLLTAEKDYRCLGSGGGRYYLLPLVDGPVELRIAPVRVESPVNYQVEGIANGQLFTARDRREAVVRIDPAQHPPPWIIDVVGDATLIFSAGPILAGPSGESIKAMADPVRRHLSR